jgi:X-Pro dipeptidyl-peptidase
VIEDGMAQPMLTWSDYRAEGYTNEGSDILRFCTYVETDKDTDGDGMADLVKAFVQVPRAAAEGKYKAGVIYDPYPYDAGFSENLDPKNMYEEKPFDYNTLYKDGKKRTPGSSKSSLEAAKEANSKDWNYRVPGGDSQAFDNASNYNYFLVRGFAVVSACGIGTYGSEGFEVCGMEPERDSHKCVVEWLTGDRTAYTNKTSGVQIAADWSNGNVAMTGTSYGGTLPLEVATTGVKGLKTIVPIAGIADWYDYTNSQGIPLLFDVDYTNQLAAANCGGVFTDEKWTKLKPGYGSYLWQVHQDEDDSNGDYADIWDAMTYSDDYEGITCPALIVQGLNDFNVTTKHADSMMQAFSKSGQTAKLVLHQGAHMSPRGYDVNGILWEELLNKWLCHYLYDVQNGIENMAQVSVQSNVDGSWKTYDNWRDFSYEQFKAMPVSKEQQTTLSSAGVAEYSSEVMKLPTDENKANGDQAYYISLDPQKAARYTLDVPVGKTIIGVPEVHAELSTRDVDKDGLMVTAVLVDTKDDASSFDAFTSSKPLCETIPKKKVGDFAVGGNAPDGTRYELTKLPTTAKVVSYGWTDLKNPGCGSESKEYVAQTEAFEEGAPHDYTFYMLPTAYTLEPGHTLSLVLTTWDPYRAFLDEDYKVNPGRDAQYSFYTYGYTIHNDTLEVRLPFR